MFNRLTRQTIATAAISLAIGSAARAEDEYKAQIPDVAIYRAMLEANRTPGWIQFRNYAEKQIIYFTALQSMHCRLSAIRYSINSDALDRNFPVAKCNPQQPFNMPADDPNAKYILINLKPGEAKTVAVQAVWDNGAVSEIVVYKPCDNVGESTCAVIKTIRKP
jgi:hypothetical protein